MRSDGTVARVSGAQGLPVANITALQAGAHATAGATTLWIASEQGLALMCNGADCEDDWRFFAGDRWLAHGPGIVSLAAVGSPTAPGPAGPAMPSAWVATASPGGLAHLVSRPETLEAKAAGYTRRVAALARYRWVAAVQLRRYGDRSAASLERHDGDNDGLWTGMLVAAQAFRFAATGSEEARALAWHHFAAVEFLHNVTGTPGFMARTAVRCGDQHQGGDGTICPPGSPNSCGWVNSSVCYAGVDPNGAKPGQCCWRWKRDTSSDEVTGHFFTLLLVHELLARSATERARAARLLCATAAYLEDGAWLLVDPVTKRGTTWGYWDPAQLNGVPGKPGERGLNSLELLGYLAAAARVCPAGDGRTGRARFAKAFRGLVEEHRYDTNTVNALNTAPPGLAFFDFRLAFMAYHTLVMAAPDLVAANKTARAASPHADPPLLPPNASALFRSRLHGSIRRYMGEAGATVDGRNNHVAALDMVHRLMIGAGELADPAWQLRRYPTELVDWPATNSRRRDIQLSPDWVSCPAAACGGGLVIEGVLPADEALTRGSSDFVTEAAGNSVDGGGGTVENAPNPWLLVYWMQRYYDRVLGGPE